MLALRLRCEKNENLNVFKFNIEPVVSPLPSLLNGNNMQLLAIGIEH